MQKYELMVIVDSKATDDQIDATLSHVEKDIEEVKGEILHTDKIGIRDFTYPIKKRDNGYYAVYNFTIPADKIKELERSLNLEKLILRQLIVKLPENYEYQGIIEDERRLAYRKENVEAEEAKRPTETVKKHKELPKKEVEKIEEVEVIKEVEEKEQREEEKIIKEPEIEEKKQEEPEEVEEKKEKDHEEKEIKRENEDKEKIKNLDKQLEDFLKNPNIDI
ncbi:30S ribosomal protein S6 [Candidatus Peregrinibacteria bacterium RIFOXYC2_FULL_33_13]|nr:MAG: 30S ribosomal protein S6 [Candidatus Peregrinibacteria bacterium GW2011_GWA2_33_10]KKP38483.1 MAG: 30S ribosomal protein S6, small subunit ribosomal protein S6 [Candidatus Peregrinibacteria bacterium GW2011_GWC2_33_13]OGJ50023.1 MAG: 30S ribosomal protein S6 [Candidatus Peregrinibacteria bacterium RIFOXYA2_FULL_33_7]OGJ55018.1 MAG: 30S ribosomal protein S6 [Candidatus Peregrinibacteria bacterium RIFOXYC2_FULL_33_13]